jgi:glycosyltransferase involved in cell wall biosynthesis
MGERPILTLASFVDALCETLRRSPYDEATRRDWFPAVLGPAPNSPLMQEVRESAGGGVCYPLVKKEGVSDVGFVTPFFDIGGVERVTAAIADVLRRAGFRTHLFVMSRSPIHFVRNALRAFDTLNWLPTADALKTRNEHYFGTARSAWDNEREKVDFVGLLSAMDLVINEHSGAAHEVVGELRRLGIACFTHEHVVEINRFGRPYGPPFRALAHQADYDKVLTCSRWLADWMVAMGLPRCKLLTVPNGSGFLGDVGVAEPRRTFDYDHRPIRLLYLGRFDRQKGVDRLLPIVDGLAEAGVSCELRIVGKSVVESAESFGPYPPNVHLHPPVYDDEELRALYRAADIVLMPSRYEGLPLTIAEAQQEGAIVLATDVGAVSEGITTGENGFVFAQETYVADAVATVASLVCEPERARRISEEARRQSRGWDDICAPLVACLRELIQATEARAGAPARLQ